LRKPFSVSAACRNYAAITNQSKRAGEIRPFSFRKDRIDNCCVYKKARTFLLGPNYSTPGFFEPDGAKKKMSNVYVEPRPKGRTEGTHIDDYVVEDRADHVLGTFQTQKEAIDWAKSHGHSPHVARVRHLDDKQQADHWRKA
jgi:hypothetical protein